VNDINMMEQANIAVSLTGHASQLSSDGGNHALRYSDYSIGQFKHLKPLLLVHGRESYRKNSHVVLFSIYKNLLLMVPVAIFAAYSGFSGQFVYDGQMFQLSAVLFTSLPVLVYGTMDLQFDKETFLQHPFLYEDGLEAQLLDGKIFVQWLLYSIWQALLIFLMCFSVMKRSLEVYGFLESKGQNTFGEIKSGRLPDLQLTGSLVFSAVVLFANMRLLQDSYRFTWHVLLANVLSTGSFFLVFYFLSLDERSPLFAHFDHLWHYPQATLCIFFFALGMWPLNTYMQAYSVSGSKQEEIQEMIDKNDHHEKRRSEDEEAELEERQQILNDQQRETARGTVASALFGKHA